MIQICPLLPHGPACLEQKCAWWDDTRQQCNITTIAGKKMLGGTKMNQLDKKALAESELGQLQIEAIEKKNLAWLSTKLLRKTQCPKEK